MRRVRVAAVGGFILVAAVGCSSDDDGATDAGPETPAATTPSEDTTDASSGPRTQLIWRSSAAENPLSEADLDAAADLLVNRLDAAGFAAAQPTVTADELSIVVADEVPDSVASEISEPTQLTFHPVVGPGTEEQSGDQAEGTVVDDEQGQPLAIGPAAITTNQIANASADLDQQAGGWIINIAFTQDGQDSWTDLTAQAACEPQGDPRQRIAIVLDEEEVISSPSVVGVQCEVGLSGDTTITGDFTKDEATSLADQLSAARLLSDLELDELQFSPGQ